MSDRTSAEIFGDIFSILSENIDDRNKELAKRIFTLIHRYDFDPLQMGAEDECIELGIARWGIDPEYPKDGKRIIWINEKAF